MVASLKVVSGLPLPMSCEKIRLTATQLASKGEDLSVSHPGHVVAIRCNSRPLDAVKAKASHSNTLCTHTLHGRHIQISLVATVRAAGKLCFGDNHKSQHATFRVAENAKGLSKSETGEPRTRTLDTSIHDNAF